MQTQTETTPSDKTETTTKPQNDSSTENVIYMFAPGQIAVIDPQNAKVVAEITEGLDDINWGDALPSPDNRRLFVNDGINAQVLVIDTQTQQIETRIDVGPRLVHIYRPLENELWTHSDEEGDFYIIDINEQTVTDKVVAAKENTAHGKLAYHEQLGTTAYATNTNDPDIHVIEIEAKQTTGFIKTHDKGGTHAKRYNPVSNRVYGGHEGRANGRRQSRRRERRNAVRHRRPHLQHPQQRVRRVGPRRAGVNVLDPEQEKFVAEIPVEGAPNKIFFHEKGGTVYGFTANTQNSKTAVVDFDQLEVVTEIEVGDIARPEDARFLHRDGLTADGWFITPTSGDGVVSIVDADALELHKKVPVTDGVSSVAYVGSVE